VEQLTASGLSSQEAFAVARIRLGYSNELAVEYGKVNGVNLLNREWVFLFLGAGIAVVGSAIIQIVQYFIASKTANGFLAVSQSAWILSTFYILLALAVIWILKNGEKVSLFFKRKIFTTSQALVFLFAIIVSLLALMPVHLFVKQARAKNSLEALTDIVYYNSISEFIIRGAVPLILFFSIALSGISVTKRINLTNILHTNNYGYILMLSFVLEVLAACISRMLFPLSFFSYVAFGCIILLGLSMFSFENSNEKGLLQKQICLLSIPFSIELWGTIMRADGNFLHSIMLGFFISVIIAGVAGIAMSRWFKKQGQ
jgi:hypothetical protein